MWTLLLVETNKQPKSVKITHSFVNWNCYMEVNGDTDACFSVKYRYYQLRIRSTLINALRPQGHSGLDTVGQTLHFFDLFT